MDTFNFPYHTQSTEYPDGFATQLGNSYQYASEPRSPVDQRTFKLAFATMKYFMQSDGVTLDLTRDPLINFGLLEAFYQNHRMWKTFFYPHPVYGTVKARFKRGLMVPAGLPGGNGALSGFGIELIEQP